MYLQLLTLRETLAQTVEIACNESASDATKQSAQQVLPVTVQSNATNEEIAKLKEDNTKLKYRVSHLLKTIDQIERK